MNQETTQTKNKKLPLIIIASILGFLLILIIIAAIILSNTLFKPANQIALAAISTWDENPSEVDELITTFLDITSEETTTKLDLNTPDLNANIEYRRAYDIAQANITVNTPDYPQITAQANISDGSLRAKIPLLGDSLFVYNYTMVNNGYLMSYLSGEDISKINSTLELLEPTGPRASFELPEKAKNDLIDLYYTLDFEKVEKKEYTIDRKQVTCKGYQTTVDENFMRDLLVVIENIYLSNATDSQAPIDFDSLRAELSDMSDIKLTVYLYKGMLASVIINMDGYEYELLLQGGDYRMQNLVLTCNGTRYFVVQGDRVGSTDYVSFFLGTDEYVRATYDNHSGDFSLILFDEYGYSQLETSGNIAIKTNSLHATIDSFATLTLSGSMTVIVSKGASVEIVSGPEFNVGTATKEDCNSLIYSMAKDFVFSLF